MPTLPAQYTDAIHRKLAHSAQGVLFMTLVTLRRSRVKAPLLKRINRRVP